VIEGHGVLERAKALGLEKIPLRHRRHSPSKSRRPVPPRHQPSRRDRQLGLPTSCAVELLELIDLGCDVVDTGFELGGGRRPAPRRRRDGRGAGPKRFDRSLGARLSRGRATSGVSVVTGWRRATRAIPESYQRLMLPGEAARMVYTDVPFNVRIAGHVTSNGDHRSLLAPRAR